MQIDSVSGSEAAKLQNSKQTESAQEAPSREQQAAEAPSDDAVVVQVNQSAQRAEE